MSTSERETEINDGTALFRWLVGATLLGIQPDPGWKQFDAGELEVQPNKVTAASYLSHDRL